MNELTDKEISDAIKKALKDAGIQAFITDARISINTENGSACYREFSLDTEG